MPDNIDPGLSQLIQAQLDANRLKQSELNIKRRQEAAALETISSTEALKQDVRQLIVETRQLLDYLRQSALKDDALQDWFEQLAHRVERLESGMMLVLMGKLESSQVRAAATRIVDETGREHRQRLKSQYLRNLAVLEEQAAQYGAGNVPLDLQNQIDAEHERILELNDD
ncbi:MAG: hypothetical protein BroJett011_62630 [Chloroflexota bacterium]|nr:MAG: hypothetical protein BroJett011_62630 [Chloroflexota bacterium]